MCINPRFYLKLLHIYNCSKNVSLQLIMNDSNAYPAFFSCHIPAVHPEIARDYVQKQTNKRRLWKEDYDNRSKIQCFLCDYAGSKASHLKRHYTEVHGYDMTDTSNDNIPDPDDPDGALCPECGEHFVNKLTLIRHLLKEHSCPKGEPCLYCPNRYLDIRNHVNKIHADEKDKPHQTCKKCGEVSNDFNGFEALLKHARRYHRKGVISEVGGKRDGGESDELCKSARKPTSKKKKQFRYNKGTKTSKSLLDINVGKDNKSKVIGIDENMNDESMDGFVGISTGKRKKYVPQHLAGICPFCELKFSDLLGHIRHKCHKQCENNPSEEKKNECSLCQECFNSVRELVTHRQLHPQFKTHTCTKCSSEFETVVQLRNHRANNCPKMKKKKKKKAIPYQLQEKTNPRLESNTTSSSSTPEELQVSNKPEQTKINANNPQSGNSNLSTLLMMVNDLNTNHSKDTSSEELKQKPVEYEGKGTVKCHLCYKSFTIKSLLRRHYISHHGYEPDKVQANINLTKNDCSLDSEQFCGQCKQSFGSINSRIKVRNHYNLNYRLGSAIIHRG